MEYIFLGLGVLIILISLFLTYKQENNINYSEAELLTQLQKLQLSIEGLSGNLKDENFQDVFDKECNLQNLNSNLKQLNQKISSLEVAISELKNSNSFNDNQSVANGIKVESEVYQEIKDLKQQGLTMSEIAHEMNLGTREVKLIWKLNSRGEL